MFNFKLLKYTLVAGFIFLSGITFCEEYQVITDIEIQGAINVSEELIKSASGIRPGDIYEEKELGKIIHNIYNLHLFKDILIEKMPEEEGVKLIIKVVENPIIEEIVISGNKKIKREKIREIVDVSKGDYWSDNIAFNVRRKILDEYYKKGYRLANVHLSEEKLLQNHIILRIVIYEGEKVSVNKLIFSGNEKLSDKKLKKVMKTRQKSFLHSGRFDEDEFEEDLKRISDLYKNKGFIDAKIIDYDVSYKDVKNIDITINLFEGEQFKVGSISVSGNTKFTDQEILKNMKFKQDTYFNQQEFDKKLNRISSMYYEEGYIYSTIDRKLIKNGDKIDIELRIFENTRAKIRKIFIRGNKKTKEKVIRRQLAIKPGDYFKQSLVLRSQRNIYNLGLFTPEMYLDYRQINDNGDIDLILNVNDKQSGSVNGGIAYNSVDKIIGTLSFSHNNILGNAWRGDFQWEFSKRKQDFQIGFTNPYLWDTSTLFGFNIYHTRRRWSESNYKIYRDGGSIRLGLPIPWLDYSRAIFSYSLLQKQYKFLDPYNPKEDSPELKKLVDKGKQVYSSSSITLVRDSQDNIFQPTMGSVFSLYTEIAGGPFLGDFNYVKEIFETKWFLKIFWKVALRCKWRLGYVTAFGASDAVPLDEKFYPGGVGIDGVRGYSDRSIGPRDGGNVETIFSAEFAFPISGDQVIGLLFFDGGNAYRYVSEINLWDLKKGAGIGVRVSSPLGLIGVDMAYGFDRGDKGKWQTHFQFGTTF